MIEQPHRRASHVTESTRVTFPRGETDGTSPVLASGSWGLIVSETPFHPFNPRWPDQLADTGRVEIAGRAVSVVDCVIGAVEQASGQLVIGAEVTSSHDGPGWHQVVVHILDSDPGPITGMEVTLRVDSARRRRLAAAHTARHLSGLALNATLASLWSRGLPLDSLGHPNFDSLALAASVISTAGFRDTYRIRTSPSAGPEESGAPTQLEDTRPDAEGLDTAGAETAGLDALISLVGVAVTKRLRRWLARNPSIRLVADGPGLADRRWWECDLANATARLVCDGIYVVDLSMIADIQVAAALTADRTAFTLSGTVTLVAPGARTRVRRSPSARHVHTGLLAIRH